MAEAVKKEEVKPKGPIGKLKEAVDDKDELNLGRWNTDLKLRPISWYGRTG